MSTPSAKPLYKAASWFWRVSKSAGSILGKILLSLTVVQVGRTQMQNFKLKRFIPKKTRSKAKTEDAA